MQCVFTSVTVSCALTLPIPCHSTFRSAPDVSFPVLGCFMYQVIDFEYLYTKVVATAVSSLLSALHVGLIYTPQNHGNTTRYMVKHLGNSRATIALLYCQVVYTLGNQPHDDAYRWRCIFSCTIKKKKYIPPPNFSLHPANV